MNIIFSVNNGESIITLPITPKEIEISKDQNNEVFETLNGPIVLIGKLGLRKLSIESIFPDRKYSWMKNGSLPNPNYYISWFNLWREKVIPLRLVIIKDDGFEVLNMPVVINGFNYRFLRNGDVSYTLDLTEFRFASGKKV